MELKKIKINATDQLTEAQIKAAFKRGIIQIGDYEIIVSSKLKKYIKKQLKKNKGKNNLDISDLKTKMRNWYRRRMNTPENMAKYKAGRTRLISLGIPVREKTATSLSFKN